MNKTRFASLIIVLVLIGTIAFALQISSTKAGSNIGYSPDSGVAEPIAGAGQQSLPGTRSQVIGPPDSEIGALLFTGLSTQNCFSMAYHAASDCDRLASGLVSIQAIAMAAHGPTSQSCFSGAYHAGSDCDRLASMQAPALRVRHGPTSLTCFSEAYHAGSDCDRLASGVR